ncbi:hypothetical protein M2160_008126 [Streptomyces sp. SAI-117]|uniref:hypothetical protein n=1 Tax=Streptomyces sp. SAI-117 TaxID=2940546 RepID=UPI0024740635|nr:hypothetical protein [Streptomyces sp. SAI-117]MDH6573105.1 hypothetical protein [Streptomyces sp. SAI-117]
MARPADWSALGLDSDPTPGDADRIDALITSQDDLVELADTIDSGLNDILDTTDGAFVGKTADALREVIDGDLRNYVSTFRQAHVDVQTALRTYAGVMREQQRRADAALEAAAALAEDDEAGRETHRSTAEDARDTLQDAASTAALTIRDAADSIASPIDECEEIWKALGWLALILVIPAMIVGGPLALFTIALNVALLIKTAVDFSQGKASITDLVLSIIGVIAPTTKGINLANVWKGLKGAGIDAWAGGRNLFLGGPNALGLFGRLGLGVDDAFRATNVWLNNGLKGIGGLHVPNLAFMPGIKGFTMTGGSFGKGFGVIPASAELTVINLMGAKTFFGLRSVIGGLNGIRGLGSSLGTTMINGVRGLNGLRFFLPVAADELGHGLGFALKIGVIDRGVFGLYRYGAFAGGQFLGATSKISGGIAAGLDVLRPGAGLGSLPSISTGQFTPNVTGGGIASGLGNMSPTSLSGSIGTINLSGFNGLGGKLSVSVPGIDARVVDIPSTGGFGSVGRIDLPTLGPVSSVTAPGTGGIHVPSISTGAGAPVGGPVNVPSLGSVGAGGARISPPSVGVGHLDGLPSVSTPSVGHIDLPATGQVDVPSVGQVNVPSLGSVSSGSHAVHIDMPSVDARITDIPAAGTIARVDMPSAGRLDLPSVNLSRFDTPSVHTGRADLPSVNIARADVPSVDVRGVSGADVNVGRVEVPSVGTGGANGADLHLTHADVPSGASAAHVDVPSAIADTPAVNLAHVDVPALGTAAAHVTTPTPAPARVDTPTADVTHVAPTPTPTPANTGGLSAPTPGSYAVDLPKLGRVDLAVLASRTIEVRMMTGQQFNFLHTFTNIDSSLPGVSVRVTPGTGPHGTNVHVDTGGVQGVIAWHAVQNSQDVLVVQRALPNNGGTDQWTYHLSAADNWAPAGGMQHFPPGTLANSHVLGAMPPHSQGQAGLLTPPPVNQPVQGPPNAPTTVNVPGVTNAQLQVQFGAAPGRITGVTPVHAAGAPPISVRHLPGAGPDNTDLVRVDHTVSAAEIRRIDLAPDATGTLAPIRDERLITLAGGPHQGTRIAVDLIDANAVRQVSGPPLPPGQALYTGGELNLPTPGGFQLYDPATGLPGRTGTQLTGGTAGNNLYVLTGGGRPQLTDALAVPHPGATVTQVQGMFHVRTPQTPAGVVAVHTADGAFSHEAIRIEGGGYLRGQHLVDAAGNRIAGATVTPQHPAVPPTPQPPTAFRIENGNRHLVVGLDGARTHDVLTLRGTNDFVHIPAGQGTPVRVDAAGVNQGAITSVGGEFHVPALGNRTTVFDAANGTHTHDLLDVQGGPLAGSRLHVDLGGTPGHVLDGSGTRTHIVVPLQGTGHVALVPVTPGGALARTDLAGVDQGAITRVGDEFHVPAPNNRTTVYGLDGTHTHDLLTLQGGPLAGSEIRIGLGGTPPRLDGAVVVPQQGGGFRIQHGDTHVAVDAQGVHTDDIATLTPAQGSGLVHTPATGANPVPVLKDMNGAPVPHASVTAGPGGTFTVTRGVVDGGGAPIGRFLEFHPAGAVNLLDADLARLDDVRVAARPSGAGFRITQDGEILLVDAGGRVDLAAADTAGTGVFRVHDGQGAHQFDAVQITDSVGTRFIRTDTHTLLDGELSPVPPGGHTVTPQPGGGYRVDGFPGVRAGEYKLYDNLGRITEQRIDVVTKGTVKPNEYLKVTHPTDGVTKPTWERVRLDAAGTPRPVTGARGWYDGGTLDTKGLGQGRVHLVSHSGGTVFERRTLPDGHVLDAYHSSAGVGDFGRFNQRGGWTEYDANGAVVRHGTRHWGESGRSWFDVTTTMGIDTRVRHFQATPDGGHVLAQLDNKPLTQSFAKTTWTRYDGDHRPIAHGTRDWGPGRGFTDTMLHPRTGESVVVHEKWGRFTWSPHDVRRFHQTKIGADGVPKAEYTSWSAHGKENGAGVTLKNGDLLETRRFAEQRPPVSWQWLTSGDYRAMNLDQVPWLKRDNNLQVHHFTQTPAGGGAPVHGMRFVSADTTTDVLRTGVVVRESRKLLNGDTLTVGDVKLPAGVTRHDGYLPWSQGAGKPQGHRTYNGADFTSPTIDGRRVIWQDRVAVGPAGGDWYTPNIPGRQWNVVRSGLDDGTVVEYRPAPGQAPPVHLNNGDWTRYDHHGLVVARQDTWPDPAGTGNHIQVTSTGMLDGTVRWTDSLGNSGVRKLNHHRGDVTPWGWDRETFQDFDLSGQLVRDHRLLAKGTTIDAWSVPDPAGGRTWHWNKVGADGTVRAFGTGPGDRIRRWFDADGTQLPDWRPGARWQDQVPGTNQVVQEIPAKPAGTSWFTDAPHRVREYTADPAGLGTIDPHVWKEYENGVEIGRKVELRDGTYLESEDWHKQWRRYGTDGVTLIDQRTVAGLVWHTDTFGRVSLVGRETNFTGALAEFRGFSRTWKEANIWQWGASVDGASTVTPFAYRAGRQLLVEFVQEWILDFTMNLAVYGIVAAATGTPFGVTDVAKAAFGATVSAGVKGTFSAGHLAAYRGGPWRTGLGQVDEGNPYNRRPNDKNWGDEWAGNEKVLRWRTGSYDFGVGLASGMVAGFVGGAATAAVFGVKDKDGNTVKLSGTDALLAGAIGMAGGAIGGISTGLGRTLLTNNLAGRWFHRGGFLDTIAIGASGKLIDKTFYQLFLMKELTVSIGPGYYTHPADGSNGGTTA